MEIISIALLLNILFYVICVRLSVKNFINYFIGFIFYSLLLVVIIVWFKIQLLSNNFISFFLIYILFFISLFLSVSTKNIKSPTFLIFEALKKRKKKNQIVNYLNKYRVIEVRIKDLERQNIIEIKKGNISLKKNLNIVVNILVFLKNFFKLRSEG